MATNRIKPMATATSPHVATPPLASSPPSSSLAGMLTRFGKGWVKGMVAGSVSAALCSPLDVLITQRQAKLLPLRQLVKQTSANYGWRGFYRGLHAAVVARGLFYSLSMPLHYSLSERLQYVSTFADQPMLTRVVSSYVSGNVGSFIANPFFLVKVRSQTTALKRGYGSPGMQQTAPSPPGVLAPFRHVAHVARQEGARALLRGYNATLVKNIDFAIYMPLSDWLAEDYGWHPSLSAFVGRSAASLITYPIEPIRTIQRDEKAKRAMHRIGYELYTHHGVRYGLYRGYVMYACKSVPNAVIVYTLFAWMRRYWS